MLTVKHIIKAVMLGILLTTSHLALAKAVQIGDLVQVNLPGEASLNKGFQVDKTGRISLPEVGLCMWQALKKTN
ncbi:hypothetical protein JCM19231_1794 [Vibrio ishigakensis]|uniref:Uncharacterized protein n=1 Tax=Vibrio ishigakensis TaxID=1481914 RepID=A0A0B8P385_9VIBR|nr:hypothetical protein JCM19231_1794 [Vibrio ishigakensis]